MAPMRKYAGRVGGALAGGLLSHLSGLPLMGDAGGALAGERIGGLLDNFAARADARVMGHVGHQASNSQRAADALEAYRLQQNRKRQGLLGQIPQYLLPYAH
jgi:hypothetical protein